MIVLHATWIDGALHLWGESPDRIDAPTRSADQDAQGSPDHPFASTAAELESLLTDRAPRAASSTAQIDLRLPQYGGRPVPSPRLAHAVGHSAHDEALTLGRFRVDALLIAPDDVCAAMDQIMEGAVTAHDSAHDGAHEREFVVDASVRFFEACVRLVRSLLAQQRFVPSLRGEGGTLDGAWQPWLADEATTKRVGELIATLPPIARAGVDRSEHDPWVMLEDFTCRVTDAECRKALIADDLQEAIDGRDQTDPHVRWLAGLLDGASRLRESPSARDPLPSRIRTWIATLEERGVSSKWRLRFLLSEPEASSLIPDYEAPGDDVAWILSFHLEAVDDPSVVVDASDLWLLSPDSATIMGRQIEQPQELLLGELGRASRLYKKLERALDEPQPDHVELTTREAYHFLREAAPVLGEQGFTVIAPRWWDEPSVRLGAHLYIDSDPISALDLEAMWEQAPSGSNAKPTLGVRALVNYRWEITIGGATLTIEEFEQLAKKGSPLLRIGGSWVEIRPEDVSAAVKFIRDHPGGETGLRDALRFAFAADARETGIPVVGIEATGWVGALLGGTESHTELPLIEQPKSFHGTLRPYQLRGLSWIWFLEKLGFGPCLADDMGLGKTIQVLALLAHEREAARKRAPEQVVPPTLLVVPMSVVGNWVHEARRFCPDLKIMVHHGPDRHTGDAFLEQAQRSDAVITTYALAHRDVETLERVSWGRVVLDEAQFIKNPGTKQARAVRAIAADARLALTGTPVENRLSELWSIVDFLNPEYLGTSHTFRKRFAIPIERYRDGSKARQLRGLVQPFILRRLKSDPNILVDLPEKVETREFAPLTSEQAGLYESCVNRLMAEVDRSEGIERRGVVLSALVRLKQVCNHPSLILKDHDKGSTPPDPKRSGKCIRLIEMLDEVLAGGESSLIFTQYRKMAELLAPMLRHEFDRDVLVLHGGTTQKDRVSIVETFQRADGKHPILIASLKAGGVGLNLTAATHVFHFDRWWNPAVENQATDRAYRIGQTRSVQVHKFVISGTLEERIDEMIERKVALAEEIIGSGEAWLTEMSSDQLRDVLTLRREAIAD